MTEQPQSKQQTMIYERVQIKFFYPVPIRKGKCVSCGRTVISHEIKTTQLHHTVYKYELKTVRANPVLAFNFTLELCYGCHPIADGFRDLLLANPRGALRQIDKIINVGLMLPPEQQKHFTFLCRKWLKLQNGNGEE